MVNEAGFADELVLSASADLLSTAMSLLVDNDKHSVGTGFGSPHRPLALLFEPQSFTSPFISAVDTLMHALPLSRLVFVMNKKLDVSSRLAQLHEGASMTKRAFLKK